MELSNKKGQSSLELLVTVSFGLVILLPIIVLAFIQIANSTSNLSATQAQAAATKLADIATEIGAQGFPARQLVLVQVPPDVQAIYVGNLTDGVGHEIIFLVNTNAGTSYVTSYTPINVSGFLNNILQTGTYLLNVSAQTSCPSNNAVPCVYIKST